MASTAPEAFGDILRRTRRAAGLTQEELAERAGISPRTISDLERGVYPTAKFSTARQLVDALQLTGEEREAFESAARGDFDVAAVPAGSVESVSGVSAGTLPLPTSAFIGRAAELAVVAAMLAREEARLITFTGPGGTGKTRLAIEAARAAAPRFTDGVAFVPLAPIADWRLVLPAIASALGVRETEVQPLAETVRTYLRDKHCLLLVLDNFEHLLPAAPLVAELLTSCAGLHVLVTSREALHLSGEHLFPVPPMAVPSPTDMLAPDNLSRHDATALFVQRAQAANPHVRLTLENVPIIAEICARLDGLPLAIELAASRVGVLPPSALLQRLANRLVVLTGGARDAPTRQQTLRNTIDWSYRLLSGDEQLLYARLSVFAGGCTLELAQAVCDAEGQLDLLDVLGSLVAKSLVQQVGEEEPRFAMLETIREHAAEMLRESGEADAVRQRHAESFLQLAEEGDPELRGPRQLEWLARFGIEHDNFRLALRWSADHGENCLLARLAVSLTHYWAVRGHLGEGIEWMRMALAGADEAPDRLRARLYCCAGMLFDNRSEVAEAEATLTQSIRLWRAIGDRAGLAESLYRMGFFRIQTDDYESAAAILRESVEHATAMGNLYVQGNALLTLAHLASRHGDFHRAEQVARESLSLMRQVGDRSRTAFALAAVADILDSLGRSDEAEVHLLDALAYGRQVDDYRLLGVTLILLGFISWRRHECPRARWYYQDGLRVFQRAGSRWGMILALNNLGEVAIRAGDSPAALVHLREALRLSRDAGFPERRRSGLTLEYVAWAATLSGDAAQAARLWGAVSRIDLPPYFDRDELAEHERFMAQARALISAAEWEATWEAGAALSLEEVAAEVLARGDRVPVESCGAVHGSLTVSVAARTAAALSDNSPSFRC